MINSSQPVTRVLWLRPFVFCVCWLAVFVPPAVGATLFSDDFEDGALAPWTLVAGDPDDAEVNGDTSQSGTQSLALGPGFPFGGTEVQSPAIDTSGPNTTLELWIRRGDNSFSNRPESGRDLELYYIDDTGARQLLDTFQGGGTGGEVFTPSYSLPANARHPDFRVVLSTTFDFGFGYWHVDDVAVTQSQPPDTPVDADLSAEYRFDESAWNGTAGEVTENSGNASDGTAQGGATTAEASPAVAGDPGTCRYGDFEGTDDYVEVPNLSDRLNDTATLTFWIRTPAGYAGNDTGWRAPNVTGVEDTGGSDDIFWGWIDGSGRIGVTVGNDYAADQKSTTAINDGNWHHVALSRDGDSGETRVFVDGTLENTGLADTGTIGNAFSSIGRLERTGDSPIYLNAELDEVRIYDGILEESEVQAVRDDTHPCPGAGLVAWQRLDEISYDGSPGEVLDASGNGNTGRTEGNVTAYPASDPERQVCSGAVVPANTSTGDIDAIDTGVNVADELGDAGSINFWFRSPDRWRQLGSDRVLFDASEGGTGSGPKYFYLALTDPTSAGGPSNRGARLAFGLEDSDDTGYEFETDRIDIDRNTWTHIGVTWDLDAETISIYVNGEQQESFSFSGSTNTLGNLRSLYLGDNRGNYQAGLMNGNSADGRYDEIRLYDRVINASQMAADRDATHPCTATVDRFDLSHDGAGINCRAEDVVLRAEDASGNAVTDYTGSVDLSTTTGNGDWAIGTGNGNLAGGGGGDGSATYTFANADNGEVTLAFANTHAETLNIDATDGTASDDDTEGDITFRPWGLEFAPDPIPTQIAGRPFDLTLTAVGELPSDPGCNVIEEYDGDRDLAFWFDYENPGSGSVDVTVDGTGIASSEASASEQTITFNGGTATVPVDYRDAGEIQLHAQDDDGIGEPPAGGGDELVSGGVIGGGTNPFVVRPFGFYLDFDPDDNGTYDDRDANATCGVQTSCATNASGDVFATAAADFDLRIAAVVWQSVDDSDDDGRPDSNRILADNALTPNFGQEATAETVDLADTLVAPSPGAPGSLANATGIGGFSGGVREVTDLRYSEVGIIDLDATLSDAAYLGSVDVTGAVGDIGRFIPADFAVGVRDAGMYAATCNGTFSYVEQAFGYAAEPMLNVTARNAGGAPTKNYRGNFIKLDGGDVDVTPPPSDAEEIGNVSGITDVAVTTALNTGVVADDGGGDALGDGVLVYTFDSGDSYKYDKVLNARIDPFDANLPITVDDVTDDDGVTNGDLPSPNPFKPTGAEIRFGQLSLQNTYGPETEDLTVSLQAEYFDGDDYTVNTADGCTPLSMTGDPNHARVQLDNNGTWVRADETVDLTGGTGGTTEGTGITGLGSGVGALTLAAPGVGNTGFASVRADLADFPWLQGDWDDDGNYDDLPTARATFGVYRGHDRIIYWREVQ